ncbi:MAG TPA: NADPH:quinone oxidoreductase family protein [Rubrivivax sp.]|nr:NADPH:quinone oxidoreductase family protein [Rubrivivax sp.]HPO20160.1 NADPH:quinone oxidoreductase family protein [Rubrivivax sp.]
MNTHRVWVCSELREDFGGLQLREQPALPCPPGQVRVRVLAAALNFPDLLMAQGRYQHRPALPFVPGLEGAGRVVECGDGVGWPARGDAVCWTARLGAFSEELLAPAQELRALPAGFGMAEGAAYGVAALTAWEALVRRGDLQHGETLLVHGAGGGTGLAAVQLGRHLGATVIATASSPAKLDAARAAGATHTLLLAAGAQGLGEAVKTLSGGRGADVVFDPVGGDVFDASLHCIAWGGRLLVVGFASGRIGSVSANLPLIKGFAVIGVRAGEAARRDPERGLQNRQAVQALAARGLFRPHIGARFGFEQLPQAYRALAGRGVAGKVVIDMPAKSR